MVTVPDRLLDRPEVDVLHRSAGLVVLRKRLGAPLRERPSYVAMHALTLVAEGEQVVYDAEAGRRIRVRAGEVGVMRRGVYSLTDLLAGDTGAFATTVVFLGDALLDVALGGGPRPRGERARSTGPDLARLSASPATRSWAAQVGELGAELEGAAAEAHYRGRAVELLHLLLEVHGATAREALASLRARPHRSLREIMRAHFDKPLAVEDYARLTGRSVRTFRRDFRARFGVSPKRWLVERRLERARELVRAGERSVADVAATVGYASTSHFIEVYRGAFGVTPGAELAGGV